MSENEDKHLKAMEELELAEDDSSNLAEFPQTWSDLPVPIWEKVLKNLKLEDFKNFNLACKKFHEIADNYPSFQLKINKKILNKADAEILRTSRKLYNSIKIIRVQEGLNDHYNLLEEIFKRTGTFIKKLELDLVHFDCCMLLELLKLLPNLTSLKLSVDDKKSKNFSIEKEAAVFLPKLKHIEINDWDGSKPINLNILKGCAIEEVILDCVSDSISTVALVTFLKSHEQNLKKLYLRSDSTSLNFMDVLASLDNLKLESLNLQSARDDVEKFLIFARKCPSLKTMILWMNPLTDQIINVICDNFKQLEKLQLEGVSNMTRISADCFHKLTNLRILDISTITYDFHPLSGFRFQTNKKLEELIVPYYDIPPGFFARLKIYIPNLKKLDCMISTTEVIEKLMEYYEDLEHLSILHGCNWDDEFVQSSLNEKPMLKLKDLYLQGCIRNIDIKTARKIVRIFCNLEYLRIDECGRLSEKAVKVLLRGLKNLKELRLCRIRNQLSDQVLHYLNDYGKKLQIVYLDAEYDLNLVQEILVDKKGLQISGRNFSSSEKDVGERRPYF